VSELTTPLVGVGVSTVIGLFGWLVKRALSVQDRAQAARDTVEERRHEAIQQMLREQKESLQTEIRATRSDVRLVVGEVAEHGEKLSGAAVALDAVAGRITRAEAEIQKLVRYGCAHRPSCSGGGEGGSEE